MKKLIVLLPLLIASATAQTAPAPAAQQPSKQALEQTIANQDPSALKAKQLIQQMIHALGGQAYLTYSTMTQEGRTYTFFQGQPNGLGTQFWRFWEYPDKDRVELTKQRDVIYLYVGDKGYEITYKGTAAMDATPLKDYLRRRRHTLDIVLREWLKDPKTIYFYDGPGVAEQKMVDKVTVLNGNNDSATIGIDPISHLPVQLSFSYRDFDRLKSEEAEIFGNWHNIDGIMTPYAIVRKKNGEYIGQRFLVDVKYNMSLASSLFTAKVTYNPKTYRGK